MGSVRATFGTMSVLSLVGGFVVAIALFVFGLVSGLDNDKYGKVPLPGEGVVTLPKGEVTVYYEERFSAPDGLTLYRVRSVATHRQVPSQPKGGNTYEINSVNGTSIATLDVPRAGRYSVTGRAQGTSLTQPALTFGPPFKIGDVFLRAGLAIGAGLALCAVFALLALLARRRPTAKWSGGGGPVPAPHSSAPMAAWQRPPTPAPSPPADPPAALAKLEEDRRLGRIQESDYQARRKAILDQI